MLTVGRLQWFSASTEGGEETNRLAVLAWPDPASPDTAVLKVTTAVRRTAAGSEIISRTTNAGTDRITLLSATNPTGFFLILRP
jgi:hypothetical protein